METAITKVIEQENIQTHLTKHLDGPICTKIQESIESIENRLGANMEKNIKKQIQSCFEGGFKNVLLQTSEIIKANVTQNLALVTFLCCCFFFYLQKGSSVQKDSRLIHGASLNAYTINFVFTPKLK